MSSNPIRLQILFEKYLANACTKEELAEFWDLMSGFSENDTLSEQLQTLWEHHGVNDGLSGKVNKERIFHRILEKARTGKTDHARVHRRSPGWRRLAVAASVAVMVAAGYWLLLQGKRQRSPDAVARVDQVNDIAPGGNKATLTLSNGAKIMLDSARQGALARLGNVNVLKVNNGQLAYKSGSIAGQRPAAMQYNTLTTPMGGQYKIVLADGTKVWLNALSSIRFPTAFLSKERHVEITGEAYFEVAERAGQPFTVSVGAMDIEVLGTHFNINAYGDEPETKTTLLEGSIKVVQSRSDEITSKPIILRPGQQLRIKPDGKTRLVRDADIDEAVGWKDGLFVFHNDDLSSVMRRLARWYDVEVTYDSKTPTSHVTGSIRRNENLSKVLKMLELAEGADFDIAGREVIVKDL